MKTDNDYDMFLSETYEVRDELSGLDEVVSTKRLTAIILDPLPADKCLNVKKLGNYKLGRTRNQHCFRLS